MRAERFPQGDRRRPEGACAALPELAAPNKRRTGAAYERRAAEYLQHAGMRVVCMNYRTRYGEIDIVAEDGGTLVFTEVKYKRSGASGAALEMVDRRKQAQIVRVARQYLYEHRVPEDRPVRFDCVGVTGSELVYVRDAFGA